MKIDQTKATILTFHRRHDGGVVIGHAHAFGELAVWTYLRGAAAIVAGRIGVAFPVGMSSFCLGRLYDERGRNRKRE